MMKSLTTISIAPFTKNYDDCEAVVGLQQRNRRLEEWFYKKLKRYFDDKFSQVFFDRDRKQEIFQSAFLKLWMEIDNRRICVRDHVLCRQQADGVYRPMTCNLQTFLMAFAKNEYRELVRSNREEYVAEVFGHTGLDAETYTVSYDTSESMDEQKKRIVDECIQQMSPRCVEVLTLFYYEEKSLDEIMELRKDKNVSKNGLKTAKNKCMTTLRERVTVEMKKYHLAV